MGSPTYDVEATSLSLASSGSPKKKSFIRKWGLALVAVSGVIAVNVALLGPTGNKIPALSEKSINTIKMGEERTLAVLEMGSDASSEEFTGRGFGSRNLTEEEGGVMEYTRRRHRVLGDYTHEDVSGKFKPFGKWSVSLIYFAFWVFLMFPNWFLPIGRPGIALGGGLSMVVWRFFSREKWLGPRLLRGESYYYGATFLAFWSYVDYYLLRKNGTRWDFR